MAGFCPFDLERRPCGEHACHLYRRLAWQNEQGVAAEEWDCVFAQHLKMQVSAAREQGRTQASLDKAATNVAEGFGGLLQLAAVKIQQQALANGKETG